MLEHFKDAPINIFKTPFSIFAKKCTWPKKLPICFLHIVEVLNVLNLCGVMRAVNSAIFHLCCTFIQEQLVKRKRKQYIPCRDIFNSVSISKHD